MNQLLQLSLITILLFCFSCSAPQKQEKEEATEQTQADEKFFHPSKGGIEVIDAKLAELINVEAKIEVLAEGFWWSEGPVWVPDGEFLVFSDVPRNTAFRWSEKDSISVYLKPSGYTGSEERGGETGSNGLMLNAQGQLVLCQHGNRSISIMNASTGEPKSEFITLSGSHDGKKFNSPNDLTIHSNGDIYFTDPPYGLEGRMEDPSKEIEFQGVYRWSAKDSTTTLQYEMLTRPNGILLTKDEKSVIVANSDPGLSMWSIFDVDEDGNMHNGREFYDVTEIAKKETGFPDGMALYKDGQIFATGPDGVWIFEEDGTLLGKIRTGQLTSNCTFSDDYQYLYTTSGSFLLRIKLI